MSVTKSKSSVTNIERDQKRTREGWTATADGTKDYLMFLNNMAILDNKIQTFTSVKIGVTLSKIVSFCMF